MRRYDLWNAEPVMLVVGAVAALGVAVAIGASGRGDAPTIENRDPEEDADEGAARDLRASPYRAGARRVIQAASPKVSGSAAGLVMLASLAASAVLLPASVRLPRWVEAELVLGLWWVIVGAVLTTLLYRGFRLRDDFVYFAPWNRPASDKGDGAKATGDGSGSNWASGCGDLGGCAGADAEGCAVGLVVVIALAAAFGAAWLLVEIALPLAFFLMYGLFMRAIGRVANDRHGCEGQLSRSVGWGALWATVYVLPIAVLTGLFHTLRR